MAKRKRCHTTLKNCGEEKNVFDFERRREGRLTSRSTPHFEMPPLRAAALVLFLASLLALDAAAAGAPPLRGEMSRGLSGEGRVRRALTATSSVRVFFSPSFFSLLFLRELCEKVPYHSGGGAATSEDTTLGLSREELIGLLVALPFAFPAVFALAFLVFLCRGRCGGKLEAPDVPDEHPPSEPPKKGQMTVVVTDIQASTKLWQLCPADMDAAQAMHDRLLRRLLREHQGGEVECS
jgi:hypothetical protein